MGNSSSPRGIIELRSHSSSFKPLASGFRIYYYFSICLDLRRVSPWFCYWLFVPMGLNWWPFERPQVRVRSGTRKLSCSKHGNECTCPDMCNAVKQTQSKPSCHSSQPARKTSPLTERSSCSMKSRCNEKGETINILGYVLKDFLPEANEIDSVPFPISLSMQFLHLSPLNRDLPSPFHPPRPY